MTDEEKQAIEKVFNFAKFTIDEYGKKEDNKYLKIVRNLIEKQQKEIEEFKRDYNEQINETNAENKRCMLLAVENQDLKEKIKNSISKDKIKEKIKEIETLSMLDFVEKEKFDFKYSLDGIYCMQKGVVFILKELLGE